jgi:hypothetical protein
MARRGLAILFSGMLAGDPWQGGATWAVLQYVLGLRRLGHEVLLVEPVAGKRLRPAGAALGDTEQGRYFREVVAEFGLGGTAAMLLEGTTQKLGVEYEELRAFARRADLLVNVSGMLADPALLEPIRRRVYLDLDPAFVQLWHAVEGVDMRFDAHTHFVTVGMNIARPECPVPTCSLNWAHTVQPVVLERWPVARGRVQYGWTTVGNWRGYGSVRWGGVQYGQKVHSMRALMSVAARTPERFELALNIHLDERADLAALAENGWRLLDPSDVAGTPRKYGDFVRQSKAEFGLAKSGYVASNCGWFSDRSACYLASGRPVVAQQTGWSRWLPAGEGVLSFRTADEAVSAVEAVSRDYATHARVARAVAERYFDSDSVLAAFVEGTASHGSVSHRPLCQGRREEQIRTLVRDTAARCRLGHAVDISAITVTPGVYHSSCSIDDVEIQFDTGLKAQAVLKDLSPGAVLADARGVKPSFVVDPRREIETYRSVLRPFEVDAPEFLGAVVDEAPQCYLLLLEAVHGIPLWQVGNLEVWQQAARWLAAMHVKLATSAPSLAAPARLLHYDEHYYSRWRDRAGSVLTSRAAGADTKRLLLAYENIIPRLLELDRTFIHGEFHASNILVESPTSSLRIKPVDWEMAALAPGLMDLADLTAGKWTEAQRESLVSAYRDALDTLGAPAGKEFHRELDYCRLHRAVQWLSWSAEWTPPTDHAQDWADAARGACDRLALGRASTSV